MKLVTMSKIAKVSRCTNNAGIPVISLRKRSYRRALLISIVSIKMFKFDFHFCYIKPNSNNKFYEKFLPINCWIHQECNNQHSKDYKSKNMPPNKLQSLYQPTPSTLQFMNGGNLHHQQQFYLIE